nr:hypothetical protein [Oryza brachyantha]
MGTKKSWSSRLKAKSKKPAPKLETSFTCPFCSAAGAVECVVDLKLKIAEASCYTCLERYCTTAHALTEPIDVYTEWIDQCELANANAAADADDDDDRRRKRSRTN